MKMRAALAAALLWPAAAYPDGGTLRLRQDTGPFMVSVFTAPQPLRAGPADVSVLVQDRASTEVLLDAEVTLTLRPPDGAPVVRTMPASPSAQPPGPAGRLGCDLTSIPQRILGLIPPLLVAPSNLESHPHVRARAQAQSRTIDSPGVCPSHGPHRRPVVRRRARRLAGHQRAQARHLVLAEHPAHMEVPGLGEKMAQLAGGIAGREAPPDAERRPGEVAGHRSCAVGLKDPVGWAPAAGEGAAGVAVGEKNPG